MNSFVVSIFGIALTLLFYFSDLSAQEVLLSENFEGVSVGQLPPGWAKYGTGSFGVVDADPSNLNRKSLRISSNTISDKTSVSTIYVYFVIQTTPGYTYSFSSDIYDNSATTSTISIYWYPTADGSGSNVGIVESDMSVDSAVSWRNLNVKDDAPSGVYSAKFRLNFKVPRPAGDYSIFYDSVTVLATKGFIPEDTIGSLDAIITEVAPSESQDWIEFFVLADGNTCGMRIYENKVPVKKLQWLPKGSTYYVGADVKKGDFILLRFNSNADDERSVRNGVITFHTTDSGLTGTDNVVSLMRSPTNYVDVCAYSNYDGTLSADNIREFGNAMIAGLWMPSISTATATKSELENNMVGKWTEKSGSAIVRKVKNVAGSRLPVLNTDVAASKDAWEIKTTQTPGRGYTFIEIEPIALKIKGPNPFNSLKQKVELTFSIGDKSIKTLRVFDVKGREIRRLIDQDKKYDASSLGGIGADIVYWDGKDSDGDRVPTGIYILHLEAYDATSGETSKTFATVGVFRGK